jgi:tripartite-type tricarboxylate transporter receptor subunit TctC
MKLPRRTFLHLAAGTAALPAVSRVARAQTYPNRPITFVVNAAAGGVTDVVARALGQKLTDAWGQQVVIENKGGAAQTIGSSMVARAVPDGYTLLVTESATFVSHPTIYAEGKLPYDAEKDFVPITGLVRIGQGLLANKSLPVANVRELIALAKQKPGELSYGSAAFGSAPHLNMVMFEQMAGVKLVPVHYRGAAPALNDLIGEHVNLLSVAMSLALPPFRAGKIKILGVSSSKRLPQAADIPTVGESGLPGFEAAAWFGLFGTAGTPREVVMKINAETQRIFADAEFREKFLAPQLFESMVGPPEPFTEFIKTERLKWGKAIRAANLKIE